MTVAEQVEGDWAAARDDVALFARLVGFPLTGWQAVALRLETLITCVVGARQVGKSRALALLGVWWAVTRPGSQVLILSASEAGAFRLMRQVQAVLSGHPRLRASVVDEQQGLVVLRSGSRITAVPASERAIRGESVDLLLVDEATYVPDGLLEQAALPTITARVARGARVVLASTPWDASGLFYKFAMRGEAGEPNVATFRWRVADCPWVPVSFVEDMRATMSPLRFRAEYECEFVDSGAGYFSRADLLACVAPGLGLVAPARASGGDVLVGCDWSMGRGADSHAVVMLGVLDDYGANGRPVLFVPWLDADSTRTIDAQVNLIESLARGGEARPDPMLAGVTMLGPTYLLPARGYRVAGFYSEMNAVGAYPAELLKQRIDGVSIRGMSERADRAVKGVDSGRFHPHMTTAETKERTFGRLLSLVQSRGIVLPDDPRLLRELGGLEVTALQDGHVRIAASGSGPDDLAMAASFTMLGLDQHVPMGTASPTEAIRADAQDWLVTEGGVLVPPNPRPRRGGLVSTRNFVRAM